jgi:hypothetical protein
MGLQFDIPDRIRGRAYLDEKGWRFAQTSVVDILLRISLFFP